MAVAAAVLGGAGPATAEEVQHLDGATLSPWWAVPFAGLLVSIAVMPQLAPRFWHQHFGKVAAAWALLFLLPFAATYGIGLALGKVLHTALGEYLPFVILLFALFVISGGIRVRGNMVGTPAVNTGMLAFGAALASVTGTTGAAMLLVRPLIQANLKRRHNAHVLVFSSSWSPSARHLGVLHPVVSCTAGADASPAYVTQALGMHYRQAGPTMASQQRFMALP